MQHRKRTTNFNCICGWKVPKGTSNSAAAKESVLRAHIASTRKKKKATSAAQLRAAALAATNSTLELFLKALTQLYPMDKLAPSICISWIGNGSFYASVVRYDITGTASSSNPGAKQVLCSTQARTLDAAIAGLALMWQGKVEDATKFVGVDVVRRLGKKVQP